jgi:hypothetical protein
MKKKKCPAPAATGARASHARLLSYFPFFKPDLEQEFYWIHVSRLGKERKLSLKPRRTRALLIMAMQRREYTITNRITVLDNAGEKRRPLVRPPGRDWVLCDASELEIVATWVRDKRGRS